MATLPSLLISRNWVYLLPVRVSALDGVRVTSLFKGGQPFGEELFTWDRTFLDSLVAVMASLSNSFPVPRSFCWPAT